MLHTILIWATVAAFVGAAVDNALGRAKTKDNYVLGISFVVVLCHRRSGNRHRRLDRIPGYAAGGADPRRPHHAAAALTEIRHRVYSDLPPIGVFIALLLLVAFVR
ncbi:MAG: hypothetical protein JO326_11375 [Acetobacteraceae bacterium]|nr:hypothetical protein [Acetobacteraceae bacterium]